MKAAVYYETGAPDVFRYEDVPDPAVQPNGVLIDVQAIAIEGGDVLNRAGGALTSTPHIVGYNCAGVVREVGGAVTDRKPGDRVTALMASGSHASMVAVPATSTFPVPDGCSIEQAACVPVSWGTAHDCIFEFGRLQPGETVLVQAGTSGVGIACVQLAKRGGATVIATSSSDEKLERLKQYGMDIGMNYRDGNFVEAVRKATNGQGANLVVDSVGGKTLEGSMQSVAYRGRVITVGNVSREGRAIDVVGAERRKCLAHGRVLRPGDVPQRGTCRRAHGRAARGHREGRAEGRGGPYVPAVRSRRCSRLHREPRRLRPRRAGAVGCSGTLRVRP